MNQNEYKPKPTAEKEEIKRHIQDLLDIVNNAETEQEYESAETELIKALKEEIQPAASINEYYFKKPNKPWAELCKIQEKDKFANIPYKACTEPELTGEKWKPSILDGIEVSNFGRVRENNELLPQTETELGYPKIKGELVYKLVALAFMGKEYPNDPDTQYDIHHISEDGYDNRPCNLIYLPASIHKDVHCKCSNCKKAIY